MFFADVVRKEVEDLTNDFKIQAQVTQKSPEEQEKQKKEDEKRYVINFKTLTNYLDNIYLIGSKS